MHHTLFPFTQYQVMKKRHQARLSGLSQATRLANTRLGMTTKPQSEDDHKLTPLSVLKEYTGETTLHGLRYITKDDMGVCDRICWAVAFIVCVVFAGVFVNSAWLKFVGSPTVTSVESTHFPLYEFPFPAVTVCPTNRVKKVLGEKLLLRYLNVTLNSTLEKQLWHLMSALSIYQHPFYIRMDPHLEAANDLLPFFKDFNISDFMLKVLPTCEEVFHSCFWHGQGKTCCDIFHLQRSEAGFCYSFNSLTSENANHCSTKVEMEADGEVDEGMPVERVEDHACALRRNTAAGTTTGLELFMNPFKDEDQMGSGQRDGKGVRVLMHHPSHYPEAGKDMFVPERREDEIAYVFTIKVSPSVTISTSAIRNLNPYVRKCFFPDERRLEIYHTYTLQACLIECRLKYIAKMCNCHSYFFSLNDGLPECNITQLWCITKYSVDVRFFRPPAGTAGFEHENAKLQCGDCLPTCHEILFNIDSTFSQDSNPGTNGTGAYIDVYYKDLGAVKYRCDIAFGSMQLLVSFGGIVGLFLGVSLLSGVEFLYYIAKLCISVYFWLRYERIRRHSDRVHPSLTMEPVPVAVEQVIPQRRRGMTELEVAESHKTSVLMLGM